MEISNRNLELLISSLRFTEEIIMRPASLETLSQMKEFCASKSISDVVSLRTLRSELECRLAMIKEAQEL